VGVFLTSAASPTPWEYFLELHDRPTSVGVHLVARSSHQCGRPSKPSSPFPPPWESSASLGDPPLLGQCRHKLLWIHTQLYGPGR
jgi:hypothetical protein